MLEVEADSVSRRGTCSRSIAGLRRKVTVLNIVLGRRRRTAEVRVVAHAISRQLIIIAKACRAVKRLVSTAAALALRRDGKRGSALRHRVLEAVDRLIVGESRRTAGKLLQLVDILTRHRKGEVAA